MTRTERDPKPGLEDLELVLDARPETLRGFLEDVHPADLAEWLQELSEDRVDLIVEALPAERRAEVLEYANELVRQEVVDRLSVQQLVEVVELMPADDVVDLLALTDEAVAEQVLRRVDFERARGLRELANYEPDTAGGIMTTEFVTVPLGTHVGDVIKEIKKEGEAAGEELAGVFVVDESDRPVGYLSDRELLTAGIHTPVDDAMETDVRAVRPDEDQENVAHLLVKYGLSAVPVTDEKGALVGVVTADDLHAVLEEEVEEDIRRIVGTSAQEQTRLPVLRRVRHRLPLQALTVAGGLATAHILDAAIGAGSSTPTTDILRYVPIIIGLAGNVGIQCSTIIVRGLATGEIAEDRESSVLASEVLVGGIIGLLCGLSTALVAWGIERGGAARHEPSTFGFAVGAAVLVAVTWAALLGGSVPLVCKRLGIDPAVVAGPFLITLSDISGTAIFMGVAHMLIGVGAP